MPERLIVKSHKQSTIEYVRLKTSRAAELFDERYKHAHETVLQVLIIDSDYVFVEVIATDVYKK